MIDGLTFYPDFVTLDEEAQLIGHARLPHTGRRPQPRPGYDQRQRVQRYGASVYADRLVSPYVPIWLDNLCLRLHTALIVANRPNSVTVNEYAAGQGLGKHFDHPSAGDEVCILGLLSDAQIRFELLVGSGTTYEFPRRTLLHMRGPARHEFQHELLPVKARRFSLVFRHKQQGTS